MSVCGVWVGPATTPVSKPLLERLKLYSSPQVERGLERLVENGELADFDDEWANRVKDAIDLCRSVRELLDQRKLAV